LIDLAKKNAFVPDMLLKKPTTPVYLQPYIEAFWMLDRTRRVNERITFAEIESYCRLTLFHNPEQLTKLILACDDVYVEYMNKQIKNNKKNING